LECRSSEIPGNFTKLFNGLLLLPAILFYFLFSSKIRNEILWRVLNGRAGTLSEIDWNVLGNNENGECQIFVENTRV
jgi:hypothetical protein